MPTRACHVVSTLLSSTWSRCAVRALAVAVLVFAALAFAVIVFPVLAFAFKQHLMLHRATHCFSSSRRSQVASHGTQSAGKAFPCRTFQLPRNSFRNNVMPIHFNDYFVTPTPARPGRSFSLTSRSSILQYAAWNDTVLQYCLTNRSSSTACSSSRLLYIPPPPILQPQTSNICADAPSRLVSSAS
jgi:hypothetical protein